jgi:hypothetical protein
MNMSDRGPEELSDSVESEERPQVQGIPIVIDKTAMIFWDFDRKRTQLKFLRSIDPEYFSYIARAHATHLEGEYSQSGAIALRIAYSHAVETLFALIGAAVQAPYCPAGWILKYQYRDLKEVVRKISKGIPFDNRIGLADEGWPAVANDLAPWSPTEPELIEHRRATAKLWKALADMMLDEDFDAEFMSLKHGFRVASGPWQWSLGRQDAPGTAAPPERMIVMGSSEFGSSFFKANKLKPNQWAIEEPRVNWNPEVFVKLLPVIAHNINNVLYYLRKGNGDSDTLPLRLMSDLEVSDVLHDPKAKSSSSRLSFGLHIDPDAIPDTTQPKILKQYRGEGNSNEALVAEQEHDGYEKPK